MIAALMIFALSLHTGARERPRPTRDRNTLVAPRPPPELPPLVLGNRGVRVIATAVDLRASGLRFRARRTLDR